MSKYDEQYLDLVERILKDGYYDQNRTGIATYKLPHQILQFNLQEESEWTVQTAVNSKMT